MFDAYHIVFGLDDNYAKYCAVTMSSIVHCLDFDNDKTQNGKSKKPATKPIHFHLIADTLTSQTQERLKVLEKTLCAIYPTKIITYHLSQENFKHFRSVGIDGVNFCAYFRLKIAEFLPKDISRCVYLDSDILVLKDIRELFYADLDGKTLGMVVDIAAPIMDLVIKKKIQKDSYFNSGMILIDMSKFRQKDMSDLSGIEKLRFPDQDFINLSFKGEIKPLPFKWNFIWLDERELDFDKTKLLIRKQIDGFNKSTCAYTKDEFDSALKEPCIVHFAGYKPWKVYVKFTKDKAIFIRDANFYKWWGFAQKTPFYEVIKQGYQREKIPCEEMAKAHFRLYANIGKFRLGRSLKKRVNKLKIIAHSFFISLKKAQIRLTRSINKRIFRFVVSKIHKFAPLKPNSISNISIKEATKSPKSIIIMPIYFAVGDLIMFSPLAKHIRAHFKNAHITIMLVDSVKDLAHTLLKPYIDEFIFISKDKFLDKGSIFYFLKFLSALKKRKFELCLQFVDDRYKNEFQLISYINAVYRIAPENSCRYDDCKGFEALKSKDDAYYTHLVPKTKAKFEFLKWAEFLSEVVGEKISAQMRIEKTLLPEFEPSLKAVLNSLNACDLQDTQGPLHLKQNLQDAFEILKKESFAVLFIGASMDVRKWSLENYAKIGAYLATKYNKHILICSGKEDIQKGERVKNAILAQLDESEFGKENSKLILNLCGQTTLIQLGALLDKVCLLISNETSCVHFSAMLEKRVVVLCQGNLLGRYCPYPQGTKGYYAVFHPAITDKNFTQMGDKFEKGSKLNINEISTQAVQKAIDEAIFKD